MRNDQDPTSNSAIDIDQLKNILRLHRPRFLASEPVEADDPSLSPEEKQALDTFMGDVLAKRPVDMELNPLLAPDLTIRHEGKLFQLFGQGGWLRDAETFELREAKQGRGLDVVKKLGQPSSGPNNA